MTFAIPVQRSTNWANKQTRSQMQIYEFDISKITTHHLDSLFGPNIKSLKFIISIYSARSCKFNFPSKFKRGLSFLTAGDRQL